jgi:lysophospholipase L1-like esterase
MSSFAALGDSFTAGAAGSPAVPWADLLADRLRASSPGLAYRNLAREGASTADLVDRQLPAAIELEPGLATVICGANDVFLTVRPQPERAVERLGFAFDAILDAVPGVLLITATVPERWRLLGLRPRTRERVRRGIRELNEGTRALAAERDLPCLDVASHPGLNDDDNFCDDGLHASELGHARATDAFEALVRAHARRDERMGVT